MPNGNYLHWFNLDSLYVASTHRTPFQTAFISHMYQPRTLYLVILDNADRNSDVIRAWPDVTPTGGIHRNRTTHPRQVRLTCAHFTCQGARHSFEEYVPPQRVVVHVLAETEAQVVSNWSLWNFLSYSHAQSSNLHP